MKNATPRWFQPQTKTKSKETQLLRLNHLLAELRQDNDIESILTAALEALQVSLKGDASALYMLGEDGQSIEQTRLHGVPAEYAAQIAQDYHGLPGETVLMTQQAVCIENVTKDHDYERLRMVRQQGWMALNLFPVGAREQAIGALVVYYRKPHRSNEQERQIGMAYASIIAMNLQNWRYANELRQYAIKMEQRVQERTAELQRAKERIEAILSSMPDAIFVLEKHKNLSLANLAGQELLAQALRESCDLFADDWLHHLQEQQVPSEKDVIQVGGRAYQGLASPLSIGDLDEGQVIVYRDVTRFRELDQLKTQFVSDVSHELRTPLANLTLYLDLLANIEDPDRRENYLQVLQRETGRLTRLIEDLLTISRLEAERMRVNIKSVDVNRMLAELAYDRGLMASGQGLKLLYEPAEGLPPIRTDPALLNQCLSNLLTNAINYTPPGGIVRLTSQLAPDDGGWLQIVVYDNGVGILPEEISQIFKRFYRGAASRQTNSPGTGLGLSISKEIVERMGGKLTVQSTSGQGSTFTIWLPTRA
jgi:two-component system, OmpR family, phosphate regulon sensor histidine kinase PhoR